MVDIFCGFGYMADTSRPQSTCSARNRTLAAGTQMFRTAQAQGGAQPYLSILAHADGVRARGSRWDGVRAVETERQRASVPSREGVERAARVSPSGIRHTVHKNIAGQRMQSRCRTAAGAASVAVAVSLPCRCPAVAGGHRGDRVARCPNPSGHYGDRPPPCSICGMFTARPPSSARRRQRPRVIAYLANGIHILGEETEEPVEAGCDFQCCLWLAPLN